jgi:glyoxylase-like metal-dependent hydrolase (beta-lactamase superfamily II)
VELGAAGSLKPFALIRSLGFLVALAGCSSYPPPTDPSYWDGATWVDDWFAVVQLDEMTWAIGEPRYLRKNVSYLISGSSRAILFDSGPGERDITPVIASLTRLPVTHAFSHCHNDHIGNIQRFAQVAAIDLPDIRDHTEGNVFRPTVSQYAGLFARRITVTEWWRPGQTIELGARNLLVVHVPGHTPESIALYDRERGELFTGDFIYARGDLFAMSPGSSLREYLDSTQRLLLMLPPSAVILGAHAAGDPRLPREALVDLERGLRGILDGTGAWRPGWYPPWIFPLPVRRYPSGRVVILTHLLL